MFDYSRAISVAFLTNSTSNHEPLNLVLLELKAFCAYLSILSSTNQFATRCAATAVIINQ